MILSLSFITIISTVVIFTVNIFAINGRSETFDKEEEEVEHQTCDDRSAAGAEGRKGVGWGYPLPLGVGAPPQKFFGKLHTEKVKFGAYFDHNFAHFCS